MNKKLANLLVALGLLTATPVMAVPVTFEALCKTPADCRGDTDFSLTFTLDDSVISSGGSYATSSDSAAGFLGWSLSSSVGDGFSASGDGMTGIGAAASGLTFTFDSNSLLTGVFDTSDPTSAFWLRGVDGGFRFLNLSFGENPTYVDVRRDADAPGTVNDRSNIQLSFQQVSATVPVPASLPLLAGGAGLLAFVSRRRRRES